MEEFRNYEITLPELVYDIVDYFRLGNKIKQPAEKTVWDYCQRSRFNAQIKDQMVQPDTVHVICDNLVRKGLLTCVHSGTSLAGMDSNYMFLPTDETLFLSKDPKLVFRLNCMAYGFRYIYLAYRDYVLPVVVKKDGKLSMGTCFRFYNGIVTAKHCIEAEQVFISGHNAEKLYQCPVIISNDKEIDLAYIDLGITTPLLSGEAKVLDEVLVMGYPKIPMFFDFCAGERAAISSIPTRGAVASIAEQFITRKVGPLMLVTARIRGGNSGGPIIDANGAVVGVAFSEPTSEGDYDEMGYGVAYPIEVLQQMLQDATTIKVNFVDEVK